MVSGLCCLIHLAATAPWQVLVLPTHLPCTPLWPFTSRTQHQVEFQRQHASQPLKVHWLMRGLLGLSRVQCIPVSVTILAR